MCAGHLQGGRSFLKLSRWFKETPWNYRYHKLEGRNHTCWSWSYENSNFDHLAMSFFLGPHFVAADDVKSRHVVYVPSEQNPLRKTRWRTMRRFLCFALSDTTSTITLFAPARCRPNCCPRMAPVGQLGIKRFKYSWRYHGSVIGAQATKTCRVLPGAP